MGSEAHAEGGDGGHGGVANGMGPGPAGHGEMRGGGGRGEMRGGEPVTVSLGTKTIEGVTVNGTRTTRTIPAGAIGNEKAIEIVFERWYSPDLLTDVMTKRSDPFSGESVFMLTNIKRDEPAASWFQVPSDYKMVSGRPGMGGHGGPNGQGGPQPRTQNPPAPPPSDPPAPGQGQSQNN